MKGDWLKNCDLLHIPISLSYKNDYFYYTNLGASLTILFFILIVCLCSYEIKILSDKSSFSIITNQYQDLKQQIDFMDRPILFQLINNRGKVIEIDDRLFQFKASVMEWLSYVNEEGIKKFKVISTDLELERCDKIDMNFTEYLADINLTSYMCIKPGQNVSATSYGHLKDMNNGYKGVRIYLKRCSERNDCYGEDKVVKKLSNINFMVTYLGLNPNIFTIEKENLDYQMMSKAGSISTNILKKFYFTFSIGKFYLDTNIFIKKNRVYEYIIGNDVIMDVDLNSKNTYENDNSTIAFFSLHYDGHIVEIRKEVKNFIDTLSIIGNAFNIILTIMRIFNNYYSNKLLFVDIFRTIFFSKKESVHININRFHQLKISDKFINNNVKNNNNPLSKKNVLDMSDGAVLNNNHSNKNNGSIFKKTSNKKILISEKEKENVKKRLSQILNINDEKISKERLIYFYLFPLCILKKKKLFQNICLIKDKICTYFSIENFNELIRFRDHLLHKAKKSKVVNTEFIKVNKKFEDNNEL